MQKYYELVIGGASQEIGLQPYDLFMLECQVWNVASSHEGFTKGFDILIHSTKCRDRVFLSVKTYIQMNVVDDRMKILIINTLSIFVHTRTK